MYDEFRDRLMVYSGDPLTKILKRGEKYTSVKTLYVISILDDYFSKLFDAADRNNVEQRKLSIYDRMERDAIQIEAEKRYAIREAREEALAEGEARGKAEGKVEIAKALLAKGVDVSTISECTGLTEEEIKALI